MNFSLELQFKIQQRQQFRNDLPLNLSAATTPQTNQPIPSPATTPQQSCKWIPFLNFNPLSTTSQFQTQQQMRQPAFHLIPSSATTPQTKLAALDLITPPATTPQTKQAALDLITSAATTLRTSKICQTITPGQSMSLTSHSSQAFLPAIKKVNKQMIKQNPKVQPKPLALPPPEKDK